MINKILVTLPCILFVITLSGCNSGCFSESKSCITTETPPEIPPETPPSEIITAIHVSSSAIYDGERDLLPVGYPAKFTATVQYEDGSTSVLPDDEVLWNVNDLSVDISSTGTIVGNEVSDVSVSATFDEQSGTRNLSIVNASPNSALLLEGPRDVLVGAEVTYTASILFENNRQLNLSYFTDWEVNSETAEIDGGRFMSTQAGVETITGRYDELPLQSINVNIYDIDINDFEIRIDSQFDPAIPVGEENQLTATAIINQEEFNISDRVTWDYNYCSAYISADQNTPGLIIFNEVAQCDVSVFIGEQVASTSLMSVKPTGKALAIKCYDVSDNEIQIMWESLQCRSWLDINVDTVSGADLIRLDVTTLSHFTSSDEEVIFVVPNELGKVKRASDASPVELAEVSAFYDDVAASITLAIDFPGDTIAITAEETEVMIGTELKLTALSEGIDVSTSVIWETDYPHAEVLNNGLLRLLDTANVDDNIVISASTPAVFGGYTTEINLTVTNIPLCVDEPNNTHCIDIVNVEDKYFSSTPKASLLALQNIHYSGVDLTGNFPVLTENQGTTWCAKLAAIQYLGLEWTLLSEEDVVLIPWQEVDDNIHWPADIEALIVGSPSFLITGMAFWTNEPQKAVKKEAELTFLYDIPDMSTSIYTSCVGYPF